MSVAGSATWHGPADRGGLDWLNFFLADVRTGVDPFLAIYLAGCRWNEQSVGMALTVGGIAGIVAQTPAGALIAFAVLPIRGLHYTLTSNPVALVTIQLLDGIGAGLFGVVSVLVIADLTRGSMRFNLRQGLITTAVGIGASLSQTFAGSIVHHVVDDAGFIFLAAIAAMALGIFWRWMQEIR